MRYSVFLINLERQTDRLNFMKAQLGALGIDPIRIAAVDGRDTEARSKSAAAFYAPLTGGEIGCFESHRKIWKRVVDEELDGAIVVEDDVVLSADFANLDFSNLNIQGCDLVKLDHWDSQDSWYGTREISITPDRSVRRLLGTEFSTGCYFVSRRGAQKLLALSRNYFIPVDRFMFGQESKAFWEFEIWKLSPAAAIQYRVLVPEDGLKPELDDSISHNRMAHTDLVKRSGIFSRNAVRLRRVLSNDTRARRQRRKAENLKKFAEYEPIEQVIIPFHSDLLDHLDIAKIHLKGSG